jgi:hypothetical protein
MSGASSFRVRCPDCGPSEIDVAGIRLLTGGSRRSRGGVTDWYLFDCPSCGTRVRLPAGPEIVEILRAAAVPSLGLRLGGS